MTLSKLRIGFVGAGDNTRKRHLPGFRAIPGVELAVVVNRSRESSERVAREFGIARCADHWREVVASPDVDAVCIGTWPYLHAEIAVAALQAGKHVLTEARMSRTVAEAELMVAAAQAAPTRVAQIVPAPMSLAYDATVAELLSSGVLGDIREVCVTQTGGQYCDSRTPLSWRQDTELSGFNVLTLGITYEIILRWLGWDARVVAADEAIYTPERIDGAGTRRPVGIPDSISVLGRYDAGARLVMHCSGVEGGEGRNEIRLNGSRASLRVDVATGTLTLAPVGQPLRTVSVPAVADGGWRVEADFVESIRDGAPVRLTNFATGLRIMRFTEAARRAAMESAQPR